MRASRGMGAIMPSKMPGPKTIVRKDKPQFVKEYKKGGKIQLPSLTENVNFKRKRVAGRSKHENGM